MRQSIIESGRAEFALKAVKAVKDMKNAKEYKSYARKFPSLILTNGLAAAIAFAIDKGGAYTLLYNNISDWLKERSFFSEETLEEGKLLKYVCSLNSDEYRVAMNEVLALFEWLRRFASGLIEGEAE
ncbi:MAG: type III-B CRISPR module-associated protein Cmr5 [Treponema sp.]|nr:type III-B CRISPR module-associated protein Cmr5 [Treponema sp.]